MGKRKGSRSNTRNAAKKAKNDIVRTTVDLLQRMLYDMAQVEYIYIYILQHRQLLILYFIVAHYQLQ